MKSGEIKKYDENNEEFVHDINTFVESIGCPLLTKKCKVFGINKGKIKTNDNNIGSSFLHSIKKFQNILEKDEKSLSIDKAFKISKLNYKDKYVIIDLIGKGKISEVYKAKLKNKNEYRAIKIIRKEIIKNKLNINGNEISNELINQINSFKKMNNQDSNYNSIKFYEYFDNDNEFAIVTELCEDNLFNLLKLKKKFEIKEIYEIIQQINNFFKSMVDYKIINGNLKLENILVNYEGPQKFLKIKIIKITDYGISKNVINLKRKLDTSLTIAPEIIKNNDKKNTFDLWSLGIIIYALSFGKYPFNENNEENLLKAIKSFGQKNFKKTNDPILDDLISKLLVFESKRLSWKDYFNHPFCNENLFNINKLYKKNNVFNEKEINFYDLKIESEFLSYFNDINFKNLEVLNLSKNYIKNIENFKNILCPNLKSLDFSNNYIEKIDIIGNWKLKKLKLLNFIHNKIKEISILGNSSIYKNFKLKMILLSNNPLDNNLNKSAIKVIKSEKIYIDIDIV